MSDLGIQSTPVSTKEREGSRADIINMLQLILEQQNRMIKKMKEQDEKWKQETGKHNAVSYTHLDVYKRQV